MNARINAPVNTDCVIADITLADWGHQNQIARPKCPVMAIGIRRQPAPEGRAHHRLAALTIQTAVLIETALGASVRVCRPRATSSTKTTAAAATGTPVFAVRASRCQDYWDYTTASLNLAPAVSKAKAPT